VTGSTSAAATVAAAGYRPELPRDPELAYRELYRGEIFQLQPTAASVALVSEVWALMQAEGLGEDPRHALQEMSEQQLFERVGRIRRQLYLEPAFHRRVFEVIGSAGFDPDRVAFDPVRLRVVGHRGHHNPRAVALYYPHRDTWFSLSQSVIAWWIALHDLPPSESFVIYPEWFERPIDNDSERFDYDRWRVDPRGLKIGWQSRDAGKEVHYSGAKGPFDPGRIVPLDAKRGDNVIFSGQHLHQTLKHEAGYTRYSLDFRFVCWDHHHRAVGAKNVDNRSRGSASDDYVRPTR
jgi:hypothetical protein